MTILFQQKSAVNFNRTFSLFRLFDDWLKPQISLSLFLVSFDGWYSLPCQLMEGLSIVLF